MKVALLGASKGMGRAVARVLAERGDALCLLGRDRAELDRCAADLRVRGVFDEPGMLRLHALDSLNESIRTVARGTPGVLLGEEIGRAHV